MPEDPPPRAAARALDETLARILYRRRLTRAIPTSPPPLTCDDVSRAFDAGYAAGFEAGRRAGAAERNDP